MFHFAICTRDQELVLSKASCECSERWVPGSWGCAGDGMVPFASGVPVCSTGACVWLEAQKVLMTPVPS